MGCGASNRNDDGSRYAASVGEYYQASHLASLLLAMSARAQNMNGDTRLSPSLQIPAIGPCILCQLKFLLCGISQVKKKLGAGAYGEVWLATEVATGLDFALKFIRINGK